MYVCVYEEATEKITQTTLISELCVRVWICLFILIMVSLHSSTIQCVNIVHGHKEQVILTTWSNLGEKSASPTFVCDCTADKIPFSFPHMLQLLTHT